MTAPVFIALVVVLVVGLISFIVFLSRRLGGKLSRRLCGTVELILIAGILAGIIGMFQSMQLAFYTRGFSILLISTLLYTVWSHIAPRQEVEDPNRRARAE